VNECLSLVTTTLAINPCHDFSVIAGVVENTGVKVIAGDNNNGEQLLSVTTTPAINLLPVTTTYFNGGSNEIIIGSV
jgi:hypothetical protein